MSENTTTLPDVDTYVSAYRAADKSTKATMRRAVADTITSLVMAGDIESAQHYVGIQAAMKSPAPTTSTVDYVARTVDLYATLTAAAAMVRDGSATYPEGVDTPDLSDVDWDGGTGDTKLAHKLATVTGRKSGRGHVVDWLESVVDDTPATIAGLRSRWVATDDYPKGPPSAGAIGAAFDRIENGAEASFTVVDVDGSRGAVTA